MSDRFIVTIDIDVEGAEGGWNSDAVYKSLRAALNGRAGWTRPGEIHSVTIERKTALPAVDCEMARSGRCTQEGCFYPSSGCYLALANRATAVAGDTPTRRAAASGETPTEEAK